MSTFTPSTASSSRPPKGPPKQAPVSAWHEEEQLWQEQSSSRAEQQSSSHFEDGNHDESMLPAWLTSLPPNQPLSDEDIIRIVNERMTLHMAWRTHFQGDEFHFYGTLEHAGLEFLSDTQKHSFWNAALRTASIDGISINYNELVTAVENNNFPSSGSRAASPAPQAVAEQPPNQAHTAATAPAQIKETPYLNDIRERLLKAMAKTTAGIKEPAAILPGKGVSPNDALELEPFKEQLYQLAPLGIFASGFNFNGLFDELTEQDSDGRKTCTLDRFHSFLLLKDWPQTARGSAQVQAPAPTSAQVQAPAPTSAQVKAPAPTSVVASVPTIHPAQQPTPALQTAQSTASLDAYDDDFEFNMENGSTDSFVRWL